MNFNGIQKAMCALFTLLVLFCAAMTGSYAWRDLSQHRSNKYYGRGIDTITTQPDPDTTTTQPDPDTTTTQPDPTTTQPTTTTMMTTTTKPTTEPPETTVETTEQATTQAITQPPTSAATASPGTSKPSNPDGPKTGDASNVWLWAALTVTSAVGLRAVLLWGRRNGKRNKAGGLP